MTDLILYTTEDGRSQIKLRAKDQTVWLSQREMDADDFRDYMLSFLFLRYLSDNYETAVKKDDRRVPLALWYDDNPATLHAYFDGDVCRACELRSRCVVRPPNNGRKGNFHLEIGAHLVVRDTLPAAQKEDTWWEQYRLRLPPLHRRGISKRRPGSSAAKGN